MSEFFSAVALYVAIVSGGYAFGTEGSQPIAAAACGICCVVATTKR